MIKYTYMPGPEQKRTLPEKVMDVGFSAISVATFPIWFTTAIGAAAIGSWWLAAGAGTMAVSDGVTVVETFKKEKSPLNPAYWVDKIRGRNRLGGNQRLHTELSI